MSNRSSAPVHALRQRDRGEHDRHRTAQAGPRQERQVAPPHRLHDAADDDRQRPGHEREHEAGDQRLDDGVEVDARRREEQPEHHEQPDLGQPRHPLGEGAGRHPVRELAVAEDQRGDVDRGEPGGVHRRRSAVRRERQAQDRERVEAGGRQRRPPHHPRAAHADRGADQPAGDQLEDDEAAGLEQSRLPDGTGGDDPHEHDGRGVVEPGLGLERAGEAPGQRQRAQDGEHRGRVGGRADRAEQDRQLPRQAEEVVGAHGDHGHRHRHADRRERQAEADAGAHLPPVGGQATFGQDDRQRPEPERVRELGVVEGDAEGSALAEQDADEEVDEQRRQPRARREPHREDRREGHDRTDQHELVELVDVERHGTSGWLCGLRGGLDPIGRPRAPRPPRPGSDGPAPSASGAGCGTIACRERTFEVPLTG